MNAPARTPTNPDNSLTRYLAEIREADEALWLYERARLKKATGISKSHFARVIDGYGCSPDLALQFHALTDGKVDPRNLCPSLPWERLDAYFATTTTAP